MTSNTSRQTAKSPAHAEFKSSTSLFWSRHCTYTIILLSILTLSHMLLQGCTSPATTQTGGLPFCNSHEECQKIDKEYRCLMNLCVKNTQNCTGEGLDCIVPNKKGKCAQGKTACVGDRLVCLADTKQASKEICGNNQDDDCDGQVDENPPCTCILGQSRFCYPKGQKGCTEDPKKPGEFKCEGDCRTGLQSCQPDLEGTRWSECISNRGPEREVCDNKDNDCNGKVDDNDPTGSIPCGVSGKKGPCAIGESFCEKGKVSCKQTVIAKSKEVCGNSIDDDCDGKVDQFPPCKCKKGDKQKCYTGPAVTRGKGLCREGEQFCQGDETWGPCLGVILPTKELCDGKDNNCNGQIDESFPEDGSACKVPTAKGLCSQGKYRCQKGTLDCEQTISPVKELCDGKDNNCDGQNDEGCECINDQTESCITTNPGCQLVNGKNILCKGICKAGTKKCKDGKFGPCVGEIKPEKELCDGKGLDEDCDGKVDQFPPCKCTKGKTQSCGSDVGECKKGTQTCDKGGKFGACTGEIKPVAELCDGKDNDCDGSTDEDFPGLGQQCSQGKGLCLRTGTSVCSQDQKSVVCTAKAGSPSKEVCDGKDNNCDGQIDEGYAKLHQPCSQGQGECKNTGKYTCKADGSDVECGVTASPPQAEVCDGKDNDCDGQTDEDLAPLTCGKGNCFVSVDACTNGKPQTCTPKAPGKETCNSQDDDCDGQIDEDGVCGVCKAGETRPCYTGAQATKGVGICKAGTQACNNGSWEQNCKGEVIPKVETCNGKDDNCDGQVDESLSRNCYSGAAGTAGLGLCRSGIQNCNNGKWGVCIGEVKPTTEICDSKDNDCDGSTDEDLGTNKCGKGICERSVKACIQGIPQTCVEGTPLQEICTNGQDDDCDGFIDTADPNCCQPTKAAHTLTNAHTKTIMGLAVSKNGNHFATSSEDGKVKYWEYATRKTLRTLSHPKKVYSVNFRSTGSFLITGSEDQKARVWNLSTGKIHKTIDKQGGKVYDAVFSPNGKIIATSTSNKQVIIWDTPSYKARRTKFGHPSEVRSVAFHRAGILLVSGCNDGKVRVWNQKTMKKVREMTHGSPIHEVTYSPDGRYIASAADDKTVKIWNASNGNLVFTLTHSEIPYTLSFSPDNTYLTSGSKDDKLNIWAVSTGKLITSFDAHALMVLRVRYAEQGKAIISVSKDKAVKIWKCP